MSGMLDGVSPLKASIDVKADATPIAEGIGDNLKAMPKASGRVFDLLFGRRHAKIQADKRLITAQADADEWKIKSGSHEYRDGEVRSILEISNADLVEAITINSIENIKQCAMEAERHLLALSHEEMPDQVEEISETFFNRWRMEASCMEEPELQHLWGQILAGEIRQPRSVSIKILDIIKNFTAEEALAFAEACKYVVADDLLLWDGRNIEQKELDIFEEHGLIRVQENSPKFFRCIEIMINDTKFFGFSCGHYFFGIETMKKVEQNFLFSGFSMTPSGKKLYNLTHTFQEGDIPFLIEMIEASLSYCNTPFKITVFRKEGGLPDFEEIATYFPKIEFPIYHYREFNPFYF